MEVVLEDNGLKLFIDEDIPQPETSDAQIMAEWKKCVVKERRIILEGVRDYIFSSLHGKENPYASWKALTDLYQYNSDQRKLALKDKLRKIKMEKDETSPKYLTKITECQPKLGSVGIMVVEDDMVSITLLGLPKSWLSYQDSVNGR